MIIENIFTFLPRTCSINSKWQPPPSPIVYDHPEIFAGNTVNKNSKLFSLGSIFNRVNIQRVGIIRNLEKKCICKAVEKWPWVYFQSFSVSIFNREKVPEVQYSTLKNEPWANFQPGSKYFVTLETRPLPQLPTLIDTDEYRSSSSDTHQPGACFG
jgi:hypothetical protein